MSQSQARRAYGDVHLYYRVDGGSRCWYAKKRQDRAVAIAPTTSRFDWSMLIPRTNAPVVVEEDEAPRPRAKIAKAKRHAPKKTRTASVARVRTPAKLDATAATNAVVPRTDVEINRIMCGDSCPDFASKGDLRAFNEKRRRELFIGYELGIPQP